jgi:hypothetical protein
MSKKYRGKTCIYCGIPGISETRDHVLAREFALIERRRDLPIVPACISCNNAKSELESYLTTVLPFGARHADARKNLQEMVPKRLAGNRRLHAELTKGTEPDWIPTPSGNWQYASAVSIDSERLERWLKYLTVGLIWHHWEIMVAGRVNIEIFLPRYDAKSELAQLFMARSARRVATTSIGGGALTYEGVLGGGASINSAWRFSIYDGLELAGADPRERGNVHYAAITPICPGDKVRKDSENQ